MSFIPALSNRRRCSSQGRTEPYPLNPEYCSRDIHSYDNPEIPLIALIALIILCVYITLFSVFYGVFCTHLILTNPNNPNNPPYHRVYIQYIPIHT